MVIRNWFFSLQFRLILSFALVLTLALGSVSLYLGYVADREVERIQALTDQARSLRIRQTLSQFYSANRGWHGLQSDIEHTGFLAGRSIAVMDKDGQIVGDSRGPTYGRGERPGGKEGFSPMMFDGRRIGSVLINREGPPQRPRRTELNRRLQDPPLARFAEATNRSLLWGGTAAGIGGILLLSLLSRRILASVRTLNSAAQHLGKGDLSQRVPSQSRDEIGQLARTFNTMAEGLERAEQQRRSMTADVAHELRTPLSNIQGYVEAVRDGVLEPDSGTLVTIHQQVLYLSHLVEDLRLVAETEAGDFRLDRQPGSLVDVVRSSVEAVRPRSEAKGVNVNMQVPSELRAFEFDRTRIAQVIGNLLENAIRHTPSGSSVTVSAQVKHSRASVTVADGGEGISREALPHVFERFYRVDPSRARTTGGAGLGLTIAKQLVETHGGTIRAESTLGNGSRFIFDLPVSGEST